MQLLSGRYPFWAMDPQDIDADMALYQVRPGWQAFNSTHRMLHGDIVAQTTVIRAMA